MDYLPADSRYKTMRYNRVGASGVRLPAISLGLWHNFGDVDVFQNGRTIARRAFDLGITHFDLANNYGPSPGSAEENFGALMKKDFHPYRDEMIISSKAGYLMWPGPYGEWGSRKYLVASCDASLKRMGLPYVDIFYHHRPDAETPLEETIVALDAIVRAGKALYIGLSNYPADLAIRVAKALGELGTPCVINQVRYNLLERDIEDRLAPELEQFGMGCIVFSPLAMGILTNRYFSGITPDSRAGYDTRFLKPELLTPAVIEKARRLDRLAQARGQTLAQMAIAWVVRRPAITSALIGASKIQQIDDCVDAIEKPFFSSDELREIDDILAG